MSMALASYQTPAQGFCAIRTSQHVAWEGTKKVVAYCPIGNMSRCTAFNSYPCLRFVCRTAAGPVYRVRNQYYRVLAFRDVTKKDDSSGAEDPESETPQISLSSDWRGTKEAKQSFSQTLSGFPGWFSKLHKPNFILRANEIVQKPISRLKFLEGDEIVKELQVDQVGHRILKLWQNSEVWVKWPLAIVLPCCFATTVIYGIEVSSDLLPLWIIWPLLMAAFIKSYLVVSHSCVQFTINIVNTGMAAPTKCMEAVSNCIQAVQLYMQNFVTKMNEFVCCIRTLNFKEIRWQKYKEIMWQKFKEYRDQKLYELYDYLDLSWPQWRQYRRFVRKII